MPNERFRHLIQGLRVGVIVQDAASQILLSNPAARELLGLSEAQMHQRTSYDPGWEITREDGTPYPPEERPVATAVATRHPIHNVVMCIRRPRHNDRVWLLVNVEPELDEHGNVQQVVSTLVDITDRKHLEASLLQAQKLESIGRLAGGVAHDFNNILAVIMGCIDLTLARLPSDHPARADLHEGLNAAASAAALTKQLLIFARKQTTSPRVIRVADALIAVVELIRRLIPENIELRLNIGELFPVRIDPTQFEQVILNLAVNARDAMPSGGVLSIEAHKDRLEEMGGPPEDCVCIRVGDTGQGMDPDTLDHIFEPFFTTKGIGLGTGLGLATVRSIVQEQGGQVRAVSTLGVGSTFSVFLRRSKEGVKTSSEEPRAVAKRKGTETVLVVEDDPAVRSVAVRVLSGNGYRVIEAGDGDEALRLARQNESPIHLVVSDIVMPKLDGRALIKLLRQDRPSLRAVLVSGYAEGDLTVSDARLLAKPYRAEELLRTVRKALD